MTLRAPAADVRFARRLKNALAAGTALGIGIVAYEIVPIGPLITKLRVRAKSTAAATLDVLFVGPDFDPGQSVAFGSLVGTVYSTANPASTPLAANTEAFVDAVPGGEGFAIIRVTMGAGAGTVNYVDVSSLHASR